MNTAMMLLALETNPFMEMAQPIIDLLNMIITPALLIVGALGAVFCILLGVKYAKAEEPQDREKAKHGLRNAVIGFVLIFVLLVALKIGLPAMTKWYENASVTTSTTST
ncbi:MAG: Mbov_0395 family pilin-like conjugal transfer protein [Oscillospiraceae bacterium]